VPGKVSLREVLMAVTFTLNGKSQTVEVDPQMGLCFMGSARHAEPDRHKIRLWHGALRRLHGSHQWRGDSLLHYTDFGSGRKENPPQSKDCPRTAPSRAAGV